MTDPRDQRLASLVRSMAERELDAYLVTHPPDLRYLTGFTGTAGVFVVRPADSVFFTDFRYQTQAEREVGSVARVDIVAQDLWARVWHVLAHERPPAMVGFDAGAVTVAQAQVFAEAGQPWQFEPVRGLVATLRASKDAGEVAALRSAVGLAQEALEATWPAVRVGARERDIAVRLESELRDRGSEWHPFPTIVASGPRTAWPHARTTDRQLEAGDLLLIDFGAIVDGYCADLTRTVVVAQAPDERQTSIWGLVREAQQAALRGLHAGMTGASGDALARQVIEERGLGAAFGHALGHGLGLEVHEAPRLGRGNTQSLPQGAVVTVEPGVYLGGWGGVRLEDDVLLTPSGVETLSTPLNEILVVR